MIPCAEFYQLLRAGGIEFFSGVPDSLLKDICAYIADHTPATHHVIAANEGAAVALAAGYHLATGRSGLVYLQNSGLGNTVNPLTSLTDPLVYRIPLLLLIGWRGEPGVHDEPQHIKQGAITLRQLETLGVPFEILPSDPIAANDAVERATAHLRSTGSPYALIVRKDSFEKYKLQSAQPDHCELSREQAIIRVLDALPPDTVIVSTTGMTSREVYEHRARTGGNFGRDFLTVGCMGHASQIALGIALAQPNRQVCVLDGDGAALMHLGSLAIIGSRKPANLRHIVLNNGAHDSVGGQPTVGFSVDIPAIARACGYRAAATVTHSGEVEAALAQLADSSGPAMLEIRVNKGARPDLGRPKTAPIENKAAFMQNLGVSPAP